MDIAIENNKELEQSTDRHVLAQPIVYKLGLWGVGYLPKCLTYWITKRISEISYFLYKNARNNVNKNLKMVFPGKSDREIGALTINTFRNYAMYLVDYGRFRSIDNDVLFKEITRFDGMENLDAVLDRKKGVVLLTCHLGNWELGAVFVGRQRTKINVVTFRDGVETIDNIRETYRKYHNVNTVVLGDSPFASLELASALKRNEIVAMLVDRAVGNSNNNIKVDFFGKSAYFPAGPFALAMATGASILPGFIVKDGNGYRVIIDKPILIEDDDKSKYAQQIINSFEKRIRDYPDQWYNFVEI